MTHPNLAIQSNSIYHFLAEDCEPTAQTNFDEHESVETLLVPESWLYELIHEGEIIHSLVLAALFFYFRDPPADGRRASA